MLLNHPRGQLAVYEDIAPELLGVSRTSSSTGEDARRLVDCRTVTGGAMQRERDLSWRGLGGRAARPRSYTESWTSSGGHGGASRRGPALDVIEGRSWTG
jgi:hypothetical protein